MSQLVNVNNTDACCIHTALQRPRTAVPAETPTLAQPQPRRVRILVSTSECSMSHIDDVVRSFLSDPYLRPADVEGKTLLRITGDARYKGRNRETLADQARMQGDLYAAIDEWRRTVAHQPENTNDLFQLAADLGKVGQVDESISESWITIGPQRIVYFRDQIV